MSSKLKKKNKKSGILEISLKDFLEIAPEFDEQLPKCLDRNDDLYIVRVVYKKGDIVAIELGYRTDEWTFA